MSRVQRIWLLFSLACISGCAHARATGLLVEHLSKVSLQQIASDAVAQVSRLYPPAHSQLHLQQPNDDDFGELFVRALRAAGFGVAEVQTPKPPGAIALTYIVVAASDHIVVIVKLGSARNPITLARAYTSHGDKAAGAGLWTTQGVP